MKLASISRQRVPKIVLDIIAHLDKAPTTEVFSIPELSERLGVTSRHVRDHVNYGLLNDYHFRVDYHRHYFGSKAAIKELRRKCEAE